MSPEKRIDYSDKTEITQLRQLAEEAFGLKLRKIVHSGAEANLVGIKSEHVLVSRRLDSRTYFVQDARYGVDSKVGIFRGRDTEYIKRCKVIFRRLGIPLSEIAKADVLKEQTQVAQMDRESKTVRMEEVQAGKYIARLSRQIEALPIWSSGFFLGLTRNRQIGYMQLHWPEIPKPVVLEAHRLDYKIKHEWQPPEQAGTTVEAIESGIVHSPAIGFVMDIHAVIRVIYADREGRVGRKSVSYVDRAGNPVPISRQAELPIELPQQRNLGERPTER